MWQNKTSNAQRVGRHDLAYEELLLIVELIQITIVRLPATDLKNSFKAIELLIRSRQPQA